MPRRNALALGAALWLVSPAPAAPTRPSFMLIIADDMTWMDCEPYGNTQVRTPNLARLAADGMRFNACYTATAMCSPTRQQLYTGIYPVRNGAYPNHSRVYEGTKSLVHHLRALGYRVGLIGKRHIGPPEAFPFEYLRGGKQGASDTEAIAAFVNRDSVQPYCLIVASNQPHTPWNRGPQGSYDPDKLRVPPYLQDTPPTRKGLAKYYAEITYLDGQVGECMKVVDASKRRENTMLMFTSEQGSSFPFGGKWTCYDTGLKTCFIVRWPARVRAGTQTDAMVQYVDIVPTLIDAAGGKSEKVDTGRPGAAGGGKGFDGRSFLPVLLGAAGKHRDYVYGVHTTRGIINGTFCYPIRSVRSSRYKYIRNLNWQAAFTNAVTRDKGVLASWRAAGGAADTRARAYQHRPAEELYDMAKDPWELRNIAGDAARAAVKAKLKEQLDAWLAQQGDRGVDTELQAKSRQGKGRKQKRKKKAEPGSR